MPDTRPDTAGGGALRKGGRWRIRTILGWALVLILLTVTLTGDLFAPYSPTEFSSMAFQPPGPANWLGTDEFGRDIFSRIVAGLQPTLLVALVAAAIGVALAVLTGVSAGYFRGYVDEILMRAMDVLMSFPNLILAMLLVVMLGSNTPTLVIAIGIVIWPRSARIIRSLSADISQREFIASARVRGESLGYILWREILPNIWGIVVVDFSLRVTTGILISASLAYLGIGYQAPSPAWGLMVRSGQQYIQFAPWLAIVPAAAIALLSIGVVWVGELLRKQLSNVGSGRSHA